MGSGESDFEGVVILGCPRSGTTLVRRLLDAHSNIAAPGETHLLNACARFLHSDRAVDGMDVGVLNGLAFAGFETEEVLTRLREFAFEFRREHARREGKTRWVEKTAVDAFYVDEIEKLCGAQCYFICVFRHALDVACSIRDWTGKSETYFSELHRYVRLHPRPLEAFCHAWADVTVDLRNFINRHTSNAIAVRYEDLVEDPEKQMRRLLEFVGEPWDPDLFSRSLGQREPKGFSDWKTFSRPAIDPSSVGRWRELSPTTISELGRIVNPALVDCGYDAVEVSEDRKNEDARRRYELGLLFHAIRSAPGKDP